MDFNFNNLISQLIERPEVDDANKSVNCVGHFYSKIFKFLESTLKQIIGDVERTLKAVDMVNDENFEICQDPAGDWYITSQSDRSKIYEVSHFSCSCPDHAYRATECKHIKAFRLANPIKSITPSVMPRLNVFGDLSTISDAELAKQAEMARADIGF
jgi:hypothetical protein